VEFSETSKRSKIDVTGGNDMTRGGDVDDTVVGTIVVKGAVGVVVGALDIWIAEVGLWVGGRAVEGESVLSIEVGEVTGAAWGDDVPGDPVDSP
jgi:hypothetical protein